MSPSSEHDRRADYRRDPADRIRILHFITDALPTEYFRLIARYTDHRRFEMYVASLRSAGGLQSGLKEVGVPTFALGADHRGQYVAAAPRLAWWLRRYRIDVLHAHLFDASIVGLLAATAAHTRLRVFTGHHSHEVPLHQKRALFEVDRFVARRLADVIVAPSGGMADTFVNFYGCDPDRVVVIEHGLDLTRFDPRTVDGHGVRSELGLSDKVVFGAISKHFWIKNLDALVRGFAGVAAELPGAHLVILGIGDSASLAALVRELGLSDRVTILASRPDVPQVLAAFDVFVHAALAESFGFAIIEAMAMTKPVVTTSVGIARNVIEDGVSGIEVTGTDPDALRAALLRAWAWRERWPQLGVEARRRVVGLTPERWVKAHEKLYESQLSGRAPARRRSA